MKVPADPGAIAKAAELLARGELVAFPTETVYGLGARADRSDAVARIYAKKGRPAENPSIVHAATAEQAFALARDVPAVAHALASAFWPGPLTLVLRVSAGAVAPEVVAGGDTIALRVPAHPTAQALLRASGLAVAAPSANRSTRISPTTAAHVEKELGSDLYILDAGPTGFGIESTIVDATLPTLVVLRRGSIGLEAIGRVAPAVDQGDHVVAEGQKRKAPGAFSRHYAPSVPVVTAARSEIRRSAAELSRSIPQHKNGGVITIGVVPELDDTRLRVEALASEPEGFARELYAAMHRLEDAGVGFVVVEAVPDDDAWKAVSDRIRRAAR